MSISAPNEVVPISCSDNAARKLKELLKDESNQSMHLRVYVTGGGCSGFQYGFTLDDKLNEDDTLIIHQNVKIVVDVLSYQYLCGATIDYEEGLSGSRFLVHNPQAKATCGCGASFSM